ncbi:MAG: dienelactone hydrolase family protein [Lysobacteraceae bacterium]|nr:MAG: dienelactone hydrolase family protein [Xanthomonadaceae bacterium]
MHIKRWTGALVLSCLLAFMSLPATAAMQAKPVEWKQGKQRFSGYLVYNDANATKRPGLMMVPDWMGVTPAAVEKAKQIANAGYVVLVADMYGKGVRPKDDKAARAQVTKLYADLSVLRARAAAALDFMRAQATAAPIDTRRIGALGFCFGGKTVLELARSGADIAGVVSFHGGLDTEMPVQAGVIKASVLVLNGADDTYVTAEHIRAFESEMKTVGADWQFVNLSGAVHCFALESANSPPGCVYNERAAKRAFTMMNQFFFERFGSR